ncbi:N-acetylgalactosamine-N,N'-diacetylbacillosaminyl-diphospho-undecaprenol 4-alpha-N-acetylgalactosaminyltransferase [Halomonas sp. THAF12]|uniref:glycosyltransferase n=1 Tax=Halomonas sp. THAF12 TaxID=2587849 RepID=UPI001267DA7F|nr:glycosyltransferase [Halomonas sp. THAF12]QFT85196.1 N-acetylgalactosamine-N,N'-diacetylbacillosaminyl-diphospho-undecaprenol 4-alpha-N-acetylgalactosaminyltransferase [Halomonas sp. THAF12]
MPHALFLIDQLASGGAPRSVIKVARALNDSGVRVTLIALSDRVRLPIPEGVEVHTVPFAPKGRWQKLQRYRLHARRLDAFLEAQGHRYDLVVSNLHQAHQVTTRSSLADRAWLCIRSDPWQELLSNKEGWRRHIKQRKVRSLYDGKRIIALSSTNLESIARIGSRPAASCVIPNVLDVARIRALMAEPVVPASLQDTTYCLYVGRLNFRQKRLDRLLSAYRASRVPHPLVLIGDGDREGVEKEIEKQGLHDQVLLLGALDNPYPYMKQASALLLASDYEGLPNVLLEALACGTPVVSTDCLSGPRDILTGELASGLVPLEDIAAFADAIRNSLESPPRIPDDLVEAYKPESIASCYQALVSD